MALGHRRTLAARMMAIVGLVCGILGLIAGTSDLDAILPSPENFEWEEPTAAVRQRTKAFYKGPDFSRGNLQLHPQPGGKTACVRRA